MPLPKTLQRGHFYKHLRSTSERTGLEIPQDLYEGLHIALLLNSHLLLRKARPASVADHLDDSKVQAFPGKGRPRKGTTASAKVVTSASSKGPDIGAKHKRDLSPRDKGQALSELIPHLVGLGAHHVTLSPESTPDEVTTALLALGGAIDLGAASVGGGGAGNVGAGGSGSAGATGTGRSGTRAMGHAGSLDSRVAMRTPLGDTVAEQGTPQAPKIPHLATHSTSLAAPPLSRVRRNSVGRGSVSAASSVMTVGGGSSAQEHSPHVLIVQNLDQAPLYTQAVVLEAIACRTGTMMAPVPRKLVSFGTGVDVSMVSNTGGDAYSSNPEYDLIAVALPDPFVVVATISENGEGLMSDLRTRFCLDINYDFSLGFVLTSAHPAPLFSRDDISSLRTILDTVHSNPDINRYMRDIVTEVRRNPLVAQCPSSRASMVLYQAARAMSMLAGTEYVTPTHVTNIAVRVLSHHISIRQEAIAKSNISPRRVVSTILKELSPPV